MKLTVTLLAAMVACSAAFGADAEEKTMDTMDAKKAEFNQAPPQVEPEGSKKFKWGGDIRLRAVYFDNIPYSIGISARGGENSFQRYRFRLWGEYHPSENFFIRTRIVNEFRTYQAPDNGTWNALDEIVFDNLFADWTLGDLALRVGRQDMIYGTGKLILDGTPKDGSRTIYFNAAKASYTGIENTTIDLLGMYTPAEDELAMHSEDRDLVGKTAGYYDGAEVGGGIYAKNESSESLPFEAYYLIKTQEEEWARPGTTPGSGIIHDDEIRHTIGTRLMPKFSESLSGNCELAYQTGEDISAYMIDAVINMSVIKDMKGKVGLGWYHLSGDDPNSTTDEGWNPLWARWPQYSEMFVYGYDTDGAGRWSNMSMPHVDFSITPMERLTMDFLLGYMFAPEAEGIGGGNNRGPLFTWWNKFKLAEGLLSKTDKLYGHFLVELMKPDDYYSAAQQDELASFLRLELGYSF